MPVAGGGCPAGGVEDGLQRLALNRLLRHRTHHPAAADRREHGRAAVRGRADAGHAGPPAPAPPPRRPRLAASAAAPRSAAAPTPVTPAPPGPVPTGRSGERRVTDTARRGGRRTPLARRGARPARGPGRARRGRRRRVLSLSGG